MESRQSDPNTDDRKPYEKPQVKHELSLEIRAGSPLSEFIDPLNPLGLGK